MGRTRSLSPHLRRFLQRRLSNAIQLLRKRSPSEINTPISRFCDNVMSNYFDGFGPEMIQQLRRFLRERIEEVKVEQMKIDTRYAVMRKVLDTQYQIDSAPSRISLAAARQTLHRITGIKMLPVELLLDIFRFVLADSPCTRGPVPDDLGTLQAVCRHWTVICISTPELWSSVVLRVPPVQITPPSPQKPYATVAATPKYWPDMLSNISTILSRTKSLGAQLSIEIPEEEPTEESIVWDRLRPSALPISRSRISLAFDYIRRPEFTVRSLDLRVPTHTIYPAALGLANGFPALEDLTIMQDGDEWPKHYFPLSLASQGLKRFTVGGYRICLPRQKLPFSNIVSLRLIDFADVVDGLPDMNSAFASRDEIPGLSADDWWGRIAGVQFDRYRTDFATPHYEVELSELPKITHLQELQVAVPSCYNPSVTVTLEQVQRLVVHVYPCESNMPNGPLYYYSRSEPR